VREAVAAGADRLLLDNMDLEGLRQVVAEVRAAGKGSPTLEASGGVRLDNVAEIAATGVDFVSVGALTHSAPALDLSMRVTGR
jgi:nicotinate-nucleotide pyrophosphorylase (carboxylating)